MKQQTSLNAYIQQTLVDNATLPALTDLGGDTYTFADVAVQIERFHILFQEMGLRPGDKVAFCGKNSSRWAMAFLSAITYGAVAVPILHEFKPDNIYNLIDHSGSTVLFTDPKIWDKLSPDRMPKLRLTVSLADYAALYSADAAGRSAVDSLDSLMAARFPNGFSAADINFYQADPAATALINYTAGSTGFSKGVALSYRSMWSNTQYCIDGLTFLLPGDGTVCILPLAHMFGLAIELLHAFVKGCHIHFITRTPSPRIVLDAFSQVKPKLVITVPLVLEKIIRTRVMPVLDKPLMKILTHLPVVKNIIYSKVRTKLIEAFGGELREIIIGGAALNPDVERVLSRMRFPFTVGYGMTECGPLISYIEHSKRRPGGCGRIVDRMEARIDSADPANVPGVLWVRGENVMTEYYNNPEATAAVMDADGWMNTGDICVMDADGFLYIRGRDKNMILGPSGQNIYPEEIEAVLNGMPLVNESIVLDRDGRIVALIHPDVEEVERQGLDPQALDNLMRENIAKTNARLSAYSHIHDFELHPEEFEKTPKRSIKRYLYS